jgi:hypothetical protein
MLGAVNDTPLVDKNKIDTPFVEKKPHNCHQQFFLGEIKIIK